ncbi:MAG TPA: glycosyltransferase family 39 protein [Chloroflexota bacterium]|nr:glycosyltransferase family 39 protein [Chloroflexota bacterium]
MIALATVLASGAQQPTWNQGFLLALAAVALAAAFPFSPAPPIAPALPRAAEGRRLYTGIGLTAGGCVAAAAGGYTGYQDFDHLFFGGLILYGGGALLIAAGLYLASDSHAGSLPRAWLLAVRRHPREGLAILCVLVLGIGLRLYQLGYYPPPFGFYIVDEPQIGLLASNALFHGGHPWQYPELVYGAVLSFKLFGMSMLAVRYPVVLAGIIAFCAFYPFARLWYSPPVALAGAALLAASRYEIMYTRLVLPACTMMVYELLIFLCAAFAIRGRGTYFNYAAMGLLLGLGLYSHTSFRLVPILLALWWIGWLFTERRRFRIIVRTHGLGWLLLVTIAAIIALPYLGIVRQTPQAFSERFTSIMPILFDRGAGAANIGDQLRQHAEQLAGYFVGPSEETVVVNPPHTSLLDPITAALCFLGAGYALLHLRRPYALMLAGWVIITLVMGGLLTSTVDGHRFIGALPAIFLLACLPLEVLWQARRTVPPVLARAVAVAVVTGIAVSGWLNFQTSFVTLSQGLAARSLFDGQAIETTKYFGDHGAGSYNYLMGYYAFPGPGSDYGWMAHWPPGQNADSLDQVLPLSDPLPDTSVHVVVADPFPTVDLARAVTQLYPTARTVYWRDTSRDHVFSATTVDAAAITAQEGLSGPCPSPAPCQRGSRPRPGLPSYWTGSIHAATLGRYQIGLQGVDHDRGTISLEGRRLTGPVSLYPGWYTLMVEIPGSRSFNPPGLGWTTPDQAGVVPNYDLNRSVAHGMLLQLSTVGLSHPDQSGFRRVPFPFLQAASSKSTGWPGTDTAIQTYRGILTGTITAGHPGTYLMGLDSTNGQVAVFLDGRLIGRGVGPLGASAVETPISLHLNGKAQELRIELETTMTGNNAAAAGLFARNFQGRRDGFLPWDWLTPPAPWAPAASWIPQG